MIFLGADHGGFEAKREVAGWLTSKKIDFHDLGAREIDPQDDYPDYAKEVAHQVILAPNNRGILFCKSGAGMAIVANRMRGVRAVVISDERGARHAREHNDANIAVIAADWVDQSEMLNAVEVFLSTTYSHEIRHQRRIDKMDTP